MSLNENDHYAPEHNLEDPPETQGYITVRVGQLPGKIKPVQIAGDGCKVSTVLKAANLDPAELLKLKYEIRVDNEPATLDTPVRNKQHVLLIKPLAAN